MSGEILLRVEFLVDMGRKESPSIVQCSYVNSSRTLAIPDVPKELAEHVGNHIDMIRLTVFKEVE